MVVLVTSLKGRKIDGIVHNWSWEYLETHLNAFFSVLFHLLCSLSASKLLCCYM